MDSVFTDCGNASTAVQTAALAGVALALATFAFAAAYIVKTIRSWQAWSSGSKPTTPADD